jgi:formate dehydrogenase subunit gamma
MSDINGESSEAWYTQTRTMHWVHLLAFTILGLTGIGFYWDIG